MVSVRVIRIVWFAYVVVHKCCALGKNGSIVREGDFVDVGTVLLDVSSVVDIPILMVNIADAPQPIPRLFSPVGIRRVVSIASKSGTNIEEATVCNG